MPKRVLVPWSRGPSSAATRSQSTHRSTPAIDMGQTTPDEGYTAEGKPRWQVGGSLLVLMRPIAAPDWASGDRESFGLLGGGSGRLLAQGSDCVQPCVGAASTLPHDAVALAHEADAEEVRCPIECNNTTRAKIVPFIALRLHRR